MSRGDVEGQFPKHYHRYFFPPELNAAMVNNDTEVLSMNLHYEDVRLAWLDNICHANRSIENYIIRRTYKQIELIKNGAIPRETHLSVWGSVGFLVTLLIILIAICWRRNRKKVYISTSRV